MNGVFILDKPQGFTSFDAVAVLRRLFSQKKIGHTGTLDPMATGVLVLLLGRATRAASFIEDGDKRYEATFQLGIETDTQDCTGTILHTTQEKVTREKLQNTLSDFQGDILQVPPMYSALSQNGQRLYKLARQGIVVEREARPICIRSLALQEFDEEKQTGKIEVHCSKGTYIRTLCTDIGKAAGSFGVMTSLKRTSACGFSLEEAISLEEAKQLAEKGILQQYIQSVDTLF